MYIISHVPLKNRFEVELNHQKAYVEYVIEDSTIDIIHTIVPKEIGGIGIAAALVEAAYQYGETLNLTPKATCSYAAVWLKRKGIMDL